MSRLIAIFSLFAVAGLPQTADSLTAVFAHIDAAAKTFKGMTADISNTQHNSLVDQNDVQTGTIRLLRAKDGTHMLIDFKGAESISLNGHEARVYNPKTNIVDVYNLADKQAMVNRFLLLGFGATSAELKANYDIAFAGQENIGGQPTSHLQLVPKSPDMSRTLKQADLWFAPDGLVAQQKFLYPSGDYKLVTYSNMKLGSMPEKELELKPAKGFVTQKH